MDGRGSGALRATLAARHQVRVWLDVLLYTGGSDAVTLPILPVLAATLRAGPIGELAFICGDRGKPLTKESFGNLFRKAVRAAGITGNSAHGLRKLGATRAAENGATVAELEAIFGWRGGRIPSLYTEAAHRARLSRQAMGKLAANETETNAPAPDEKVGASMTNEK